MSADSRKPVYLYIIREKMETFELRTGNQTLAVKGM
jgi:hypothetical protein